MNGRNLEITHLGLKENHLNHPKIHFWVPVVNFPGLSGDFLYEKGPNTYGFFCFVSEAGFIPSKPSRHFWKTSGFLGLLAMPSKSSPS